MHGKKCFVFQVQRKLLSGDTEMVTFSAYSDMETRYPEFLDMGGAMRRYTSRQPPAEPLKLPAKVKNTLDERRNGIKRGKTF